MRKPFYRDDVALAVDNNQHAIILCEFSCFSTYCLTRTGIWHLAKREMGIPNGRLDVEVFRGPEIASIDCGMFAASEPDDLSRIDSYGRFPVRGAACIA